MATGDISTMVLKMMAAMTSTKAALKFISVIVFISLSWFLSPPVFAFFEVPNENLSFLITTLGIGLGILFIELINKALIKHQKSEELKNKKQTIANELATQEQKQINDKKHRLRKFIQAYPYLQISNHNFLFHCLDNDITLQFHDRQRYNELLGQNALIEKVIINDDKVLFQINPEFKTFIEKMYDKKLAKDVDVFINNLGAQKEKLLELFIASNNNSIVNANIGLPFHRDSCVDFSFNKGNSSLSVKINPKYKEHFKGIFEDNFGEDVEIVYEVLLDKSRLEMPEEKSMVIAGVGLNYKGGNKPISLD